MCDIKATSFSFSCNFMLFETYFMSGFHRIDHIIPTAISNLRNIYRKLVVRICSNPFHAVPRSSDIISGVITWRNILIVTLQKDRRHCEILYTRVQICQTMTSACSTCKSVTFAHIFKISCAVISFS